MTIVDFFVQISPSSTGILVSIYLLVCPFRDGGSIQFEGKN